MKKALTFALAFSWFVLAFSQSSLSQDNTARSPGSVAAEGGNREKDKMVGPVRRVRVEVTKIIPKDGNWVEGPREVVGITTYDPAGKTLDSVAYPVEGSSTSGKEQYLYDDKGNVVEMILRSSDGSMLSKESYKYEFDQLGNWTKMSSSVAVYENGKISLEPTAITYRTISYYYNQAIEKLNASSPKSRGAAAPSTSSALRPNPNVSSTNSPQPAPATAQVSPPAQAVSKAENVDAKKELVTAPASIASAQSKEEPERPVAASSENRTTPDDSTTTSVVQHVSEDILRKAAIELPQPEYSDAARLARLGGKVEVQILVDENGLVTNAQATSGHPLLGAAAETAARKARFSLTKGPIGASRVYGVITYNFVPPTPVTETFLPTSSTADKGPPKTENRKPEVKPISESPALVESEHKTSGNYLEEARSFYDKGVTSQAAGRYAEAAEAFNHAIKINPNDANAYARLAMAYSALEKHKDAIVVYNMAAQTDRNVLGAAAYYMWGHSYLALEKNSDALSAFKQALYITRAEAIEQKEAPRYPSLEQLHYGMGIAYLNSKRFSKSIDELKQVVTLNPKHAEAYFALAIAYLSTGNRREAENQQITLSSLDAALAKKLATAFVSGGLPPGCRTIACR